jgi:hypothetical protein
LEQPALINFKEIIYSSLPEFQIYSEKANAQSDYKYKKQEGVYYTVAVAEMGKVLLLRLYKAGS